MARNRTQKRKSSRRSLRGGAMLEVTHHLWNSAKEGALKMSKKAQKSLSNSIVLEKRKSPSKTSRSKTSRSKSPPSKTQKLQRMNLQMTKSEEERLRMGQ